MTQGMRQVIAIARDRAKQPEIRWWVGTEPDPDKRLQIVVSAEDAAKQPRHGDTTWFTVTDTITGTEMRLRRADCGLGCQCALETDQLSEKEWKLISMSLEDKMQSPVCAGRDRESVEWRRHLQDIRDIVRDALWKGNPPSLDDFSREDWIEIYYALDHRGEEELMRKVGPDGQYMYADAS